MRSILAGVLLVTGLAAAQPKAGILKQQTKQQKQAERLKQLNPALERFLSMTPEQRRRALAQLPPERRRQVERRLRQLEQLPEDQSDRLRERYRQFMSLRPARRQAVRQELQILRPLSESERKARLDGPEVRERFSPEELQLLHDAEGLPGQPF